MKALFTVLFCVILTFVLYIFFGKVAEAEKCDLTGGVYVRGFYGYVCIDAAKVTK
jgi:hypothetical protein